MIEYATFKISTGEVVFADEDKKVIKRLERVLKGDWNTIRAQISKENRKSKLEALQAQEKGLF